jgi:hypothetical protein
MKIKHLAAVMSVGLMVVACGDDDDSSKPAAQPAQVNNQAVKANVQSSITALSSTIGKDGNTGGASIGSLAGVANGGASMLQPTAGAGTRSVAQGLNVEGGVHQLDLGDPGCQCTGTSCTFTACSWGSSSTGSGGSFKFTIDGSYSWDGGHIKCNNLKYTFEGDNLGSINTGSGGPSGSIGTQTVVTLNCDMTVTSSSINGFIQSTGSATTSVGSTSYSSNFDIKMTYNNVTYASGAPTGGSVKVEGTGSTNAGGQSYNYAGSGEVTFP